ncbi:MAG: CaiB/BaiF CoA-transferase family protein [Pseudomonadota bacterium]
MSGPLKGFRIVELGGYGPATYCGMLLGDLGADVIRIERASAPVSGDDRATSKSDPHMRNRRSIALNLKSPTAIDLTLQLLKTADACTEGFRPGVAERLGLGPEVALARNARLVYGRMTGWGQCGPLAQAPGHDINYIALTGALHAIGSIGGKPAVPLNLVGDFGGGGLFLAFGVLAGLLEAKRSGKGQVIDAAMMDGVSSLMSAFSYYRNIGLHNSEAPGEGALAGAAPFYDVYETKDGKYISIGAMEPKFCKELIDKLELDEATFQSAWADEKSWARLKSILTEKFRTRTRQEWCDLLEGGNTCFAPVLSHSEAPSHAHAIARAAYINVGGQIQNAPAPRFSETPPDPPRPSPNKGEDTKAVLAELGVSDSEFQRFVETNVIP